MLLVARNANSFGETIDRFRGRLRVEREEGSWKVAFGSAIKTPRDIFKMERGRATSAAALAENFRPPLCRVSRINPFRGQVSLSSVCREDNGCIPKRPRRREAAAARARKGGKARLADGTIEGRESTARSV